MRIEYESFFGYFEGFDFIVFFGIENVLPVSSQPGPEVYIV
jgi:hypothetical protein